MEETARRLWTPCAAEGQKKNINEKGHLLKNVLKGKTAKAELISLENGQARGIL